MACCPAFGTSHAIRNAERAAIDHIAKSDIQLVRTFADVTVSCDTWCVTCLHYLAAAGRRVHDAPRIVARMGRCS